MTTPDPTPSSPPLRLTNPYKHPALPYLRSPKLLGRVSQSDHDYLFRHVLAGEHGAADALVGIFFEKFCSHLRASGILPVYDPANPAILAKILTNLNFNERTPAPVPPPIDRGTPPRRRTAGGAAKSEGKPVPSLSQ